MARSFTSVGVQTEYRPIFELKSSKEESSFVSTDIHFKYRADFQKNFELLKEVISTLPFTLRYLVRREYPMYDFSATVFFNKVAESLNGVPPALVSGIITTMDNLRAQMDRIKAGQITNLISLSQSISQVKRICSQFDYVYILLSLCLTVVHPKLNQRECPTVNEIDNFFKSAPGNILAISKLFKIIRSW